MSDVKVYARWLKFFSLVFVLPFICLEFIFTWFFDKIGPIFTNFNNLDTWTLKLINLPIANRLLGILADSISLGLLIWGFVLFMQLLNLYQQGHIFLPHAFQLLRKISKIAFAWVVYAPINNALKSLIITLHNPPGHRVIEFSLSSMDAYHIFFVALLWIVTSLIHEGCKLKNEQDLTV